MGAGVFPAGLGPAGADPVAGPPSPVVNGLTPAQFYVQAQGVRTQLMLAYDPIARGFVLNADGTYVGVHPIDQQVALALFIPYGSIKSAPTLGSKWVTVLSRVAPQQVMAVARNELNRCLARFLAQKQILILTFTVDQSVLGRSLISVGYTNLLDPRYNPNNAAYTTAQNPAYRFQTQSIPVGG
jgi:hypothetical protein